MEAFYSNVHILLCSLFFFSLMCHHLKRIFWLCEHSKFVWKGQVVLGSLVYNIHWNTVFNIYFGNFVHWKPCIFLPLHFINNCNQGQTMTCPNNWMKGRFKLFCVVFFFKCQQNLLYVQKSLYPNLPGIFLLFTHYNMYRFYVQIFNSL